MPFTQLIYVSDLVQRNEAELGSIVEAAVRHNRKDQITGMLLYSEGNFLQVLEGPKEAVHATYRRISKDKRHQNLMLIAEEEVAQRQFADWSMGYRQLGAEDLARFPEYAPHFKFGFKATEFSARPGVALELLQLFSRGML